MDPEYRAKLIEMERCGRCGNPNGLDCDHTEEICAVCGEYLEECTCGDEESEAV